MVYELEKLPMDLVLHLPVSSDQAKPLSAEDGMETGKNALLELSSLSTCLLMVDPLKRRHCF